MKSTEILTAVIIVAVLTTSFAYSVSASKYYQAGVSKGQFVQYGNFVGIGPGLETYNENDWVRYEVLDTNESLVTLILTGSFKNGTSIPGNADVWMYDLEYGTANGTQSVAGPILAGNLSKGFWVSIGYTPNKINDTQTRTYLGASRSVNVLNFTRSSENSSFSYTYFYDKDSGMLLEMNGETQENQNSTSITRQISYAVADTNIFGPKTGIPQLYIIAVVVIVVIIVAAVALKMRSSMHRHRKSR